MAFVWSEKCYNCSRLSDMTRLFCILTESRATKSFKEARVRPEFLEDFKNIFFESMFYNLIYFN